MIRRSKGSITFHFADTLAKAISAAKQHHKRGYKNADPIKYPIINAFTDRFEYFTFQKTITGQNITEILLIDYINLDSTTDSGRVETDLTSDSGLTQMKVATEYNEAYEQIMYKETALDATLTSGQYWLQLKCTDTEYFYSNVFIIE